MDYLSVREIFLTPPDRLVPPPPAVATGTAARRLRDAMEPLACQSIWSAEVAEGYLDLGLERWFPAYIWERTSALSNPPTALAVMAMGVWNPELIGPQFEQAVATVGHDDIVAVRIKGPGQMVRRHRLDLDHHTKRIDTWSNALIAVGGAPPNPAKRAAG